MSAREEPGWVLPPRTIVVASDLPLAGANAAWRAAQLAREHGAALHLLQVVPEARHAQATRAALDAVSDAMRQRLGVAAEVEVGCGDLLREAVRTSAGADLLVVPARDGRTWRERISGTSTERMVRASRIPVLVARQPLSRARASEQSEPLSRQLHQRLLACVDLRPGSGGVMAAALSLGGTSQIEVFHALSPQRAHPAGAGTAVERSRAALQEQIVQAGAQRHAMPRVGFGDPRASVVARQRAVAADLVVLGKRQSRLLGDYFLGAVAREVLSSSTGDVLVVPTVDRSPTDLPPGAGLPERSTLG